jgi:hypothetical protein
MPIFYHLIILFVFIKQENAFQARLLSGYCGDSEHKSAKRILEKMIEPELLAKYTWTGTKEKLAFNQYSVITESICDVIKSSTKSCDFEKFKNALQSVFNYAKHTDERGKSKTQQLTSLSIVYCWVFSILTTLLNAILLIVIIYFCFSRLLNVR